MEDDVESEPEDRFYDYVQNVLKEDENEEDFDEVFSNAFIYSTFEFRKRMNCI